MQLFAAGIIRMFSGGTELLHSAYRDLHTADGKKCLMKVYAGQLQQYPLLCNKPSEGCIAFLLALH